ncbi:MAG: hypothetical protein FGM22_07375 [Burkholderiaceae bacterium]|nr:hypothetical protein [Burkholderiaceae bacterium]
MARKLPSAKAFGSNVAAVVTDKRHLRDIGGMFLGASLYALVPTVIKRAFGYDTSGIKGALIGVGAGLVGAGFGGLGYAVFAGSIGAMFGHLWWSQLNGMVAYPLLGTYLWRWDPTAKNLGLQAAPQSFSDSLSTNVRYVTLPNGTSVPVYTTSAPENILPESRVAGLADYSDTLKLADYSDTLKLADYSTGLTPEASAPMADYVSTLSDNTMGAAEFDSQYSAYNDMM